MKGELRSALQEAETLSTQAKLSRRDEARLSVLLAKISTLRSDEKSPAHAGLETRMFIRGLEKRQPPMQAGTQTISYAVGPDGGYFVPNEFHQQVIIGMANFDPLLDENIVTLVQSDGGDLRPYTIPGWDLSTFTAVKIGEGEQQNPQIVPTVAGTILNGFKYKASVSTSLEIEQDVFDSIMTRMQQAYAIGFARGIGADLIDGDGVSAPQGIIVGAVDSGVTSSASQELTGDDIENIYFSVDRFYRVQPKCAWLLNDDVYQMVRKCVDSVNRPLLQIVDDRETLLGKPVYVSPSLSSTSRAIIFGDLAHYVLRVSRMQILRSVQAPGYIEYGQALWTAYQRADGKVFDPTAGSKPPIVYASILS